MEKYVAMTIRRQALGISKEMLAHEAGIDVQYINFYEDGKNIGRDYETKITSTLFVISKKLSNIDHYRFRILELALRVQKEETCEVLLKDLAHMCAECGKMQMDMMDAERFLQ